MPDFPRERRVLVIRQLHSGEPISSEDRPVAEELVRFGGGHRSPIRRAFLIVSWLFWVAVLLGAMFGHYDAGRRWFAGVGAGLFIFGGIVMEVMRLRWRAQLRRQT